MQYELKNRGVINWWAFCALEKCSTRLEETARNKEIRLNEINTFRKLQHLKTTLMGKFGNHA